MLRYVGGAHGLDIDGVGVVIVIGSSIGDNARVAAPAASVRAAAVKSVVSRTGFCPAIRPARPGGRGRLI